MSEKKMAGNEVGSIPGTGNRLLQRRGTQKKMAFFRERERRPISLGKTNRGKSLEVRLLMVLNAYL